MLEEQPKSDAEAMVDLRRLVGLNSFKKLILKDSHKPGHPQTAALIRGISESHLAQFHAFEPFSDRSWQNWYSDKPGALHPTSVEQLDIIARGRTHGDWVKSRSSPYFTRLMSGGLLAIFQEPTKSKRVISVFQERARLYRPCSALHLHLDAIEMCLFSDDIHGVSWETVKRLGAQRILEIVHERWNPRTGYVYGQLSSDIHLSKLGAVSSGQTVDPKWARAVNEMAVAHLSAKQPSPDWHALQIDEGIAVQHVYKLMFALAAERDFLVRDRFDQWWLDAATSALAMYAHAWTSRYECFGMRLSDEKMDWGLFDTLFLHESRFNAVNIQFLPMLRWKGGAGRVWLYRTLIEAGRRYRSYLESLGIRVENVRELTLRGSLNHPVRYFRSGSSGL